MKRLSARRTILVCAGALALLLSMSAVAAARPAGHAAGTDYLVLAERGIARAQTSWRNRAAHWYDERLGDHDRYPLATLWGSVPLFEALSGVAIVHPTAVNRSALARFAHGAEGYLNPRLLPHGGYAPYPHDHSGGRVWFDDNGWWGLAFFDAYRASHNTRYLVDAERAFRFTASRGWDPATGGLWWNTSHPFKSGEALAANALLGALIYRQTRDAFYLTQVERFIAWADTNIWEPTAGLYAKSNREAIPMPYVEGPMIEAHQIICESTRESSYCARASELAAHAARRFRNLAMGPQFDAIYLRTMLAYGHDSGDTRWRALAEAEAARAERNARDARGLYLRAWDGSDMRAHQARAGMLRTHAATISLFAWLAATR